MFNFFKRKKKINASFDNKILKLLNSYVCENNVNSLSITGIDSTPKKTNFNSDFFTKIYFYDDDDYLNWLKYYVRYSIEYKIFIRFIKEYGLYEKFTHYNKMHQRKITSFNFINDAIIWRNTKEGHDYWADASEDWIELKRNIDLIVNKK